MYKTRIQVIASWKAMERLNHWEVPYQARVAYQHFKRGCWGVCQDFAHSCSVLERLSAMGWALSLKKLGDLKIVSA